MRLLDVPTAPLEYISGDQSHAPSTRNRQEKSVVVGYIHHTYKLYCFPSQLRNGDKRKRWVAALRRVNKDKSDWKPCNNDRVCSEHFVDGEPTNANPDPSIHMGYDLPQKKSRRELFSSSTVKVKPQKAEKY